MNASSKYNSAAADVKSLGSVVPPQLVEPIDRSLRKLGEGRQAAAMIRYGLLSGYLPVFFTDRYTLFSDMYRDCKALGIKDARPRPSMLTFISGY